MSEALLQATDVCAGYDGNRVLHEVTFGVAEGETVVILGPNGHGKSTFAQAISGSLPLDRGSVELCGTRIDTLTRAAIVHAGLVHVPQGDMLFPEMTVLENLYVAAGYRRDAWRTRKERLNEVFELFPRLEERRRQQASTLSGGERRMLALGRGLMTPSRLLVIDEPSLGLAPLVVDEVYRRIATIRDSGRSVLLIDESASHMELADRVCVMQSGQIIRELTVDEFNRDSELVETYFVGGSL